MSEKDKLDVFMESQRDVNQSNAETLKMLGATVADLEKHLVKMAQLVEIVNTARSDIKSNTDDIVDLKLTVGFVKDAKWVFRAFILALIVGVGGTIWQLATTDQPQKAMTTTDIELLIKAINQKK